MYVSLKYCMASKEDEMALELKNTDLIYYFHDSIKCDDGLFLSVNDANNNTLSLYIPRQLMFRYSKLTKKIPCPTCMQFRIEKCPNMLCIHPKANIYVCILSFLFIKN